MRWPVFVLLAGVVSGGSFHAAGAPSAGGSLRGLVVDAGTSVAIPAVQIIVWNASGITVGDALTTEKGLYSLSGVPAGIYLVEAKRIGYGRESKSDVRVVNGQTTVVDFSLRAAPLYADEWPCSLDRPGVAMVFPDSFSTP
jgi:hypothetical protein